MSTTDLVKPEDCKLSDWFTKHQILNLKLDELKHTFYYSKFTIDSLITIIHYVIRDAFNVYQEEHDKIGRRYLMAAASIGGAIFLNTFGLLGSILESGAKHETIRNCYGYEVVLMVETFEEIEANAEINRTKEFDLTKNSVSLMEDFKLSNKRAG